MEADTHLAVERTPNKLTRPVGWAPLYRWLCLTARHTPTVAKLTYSWCPARRTDAAPAGARTQHKLKDADERVGRPYIICYASRVAARGSGKANV